MSPDPIYEVKVLTLEEALPFWRRLENDGIASPYQTSSWALSWASSIGTTKPHESFCLHGRHQGKTVFLLPLMLTQSIGIKVCRWFGDFHSIGGGLFDEGWLKSNPRFPKNAFEAIADRFPTIDLIYLEKQPATLRELRNPLLDQQKSVQHPDPLYSAQMDDDFTEWEKSRRSSASRSRLRRYRRSLGSKLGPVTIKQADDLTSLERFLSSFFEQRAESEKKRGVPNPFSDQAQKAFLQNAAKMGLECSSGLKLFALIAGERICATSMGLGLNRSYSGFANSIDEHVNEFSPGSLLERDILETLHKAGFRDIDFGLGDQIYKAKWTDRQVLFDTIMPLSAKGIVTSHLLGQKTRLKRWAKATPFIARNVQAFKTSLKDSGYGRL